MSYANIGMRPDYMNQYGGRSQSVYSPLTSVSGMRQEPSTLQEVAGIVGPLATLNSATKQLTGINPAGMAADQLKEMFKNDPALSTEVLGKPFQDFAFAEDAPSVVSDMASSIPTDFNWMDNPIGMEDWASNIPGFEAPDYLSSLGMEGMGEGIDLSSLTDGGFDWASGSIPYLNIGSSLLDGQWGWGDTASAVGAYFGGPLGAAFGRAIGEPVGDLVEGIGGGIVDIGEDLLGGIGDIFGGGCFLTTACMYRHGDNFDDTGRELTALRDLRESYVRKLPEGAKVIAAYYDKAPIQVQQLVARPDNKEVFQKMYHEYIMPAVEQVESGDYEKAYKTYTNLINWVNKETEEV